MTSRAVGLQDSPVLRLLVVKKSPCLEPVTDLLVALQNQNLITDFALLEIEEGSAAESEPDFKRLLPDIGVKRFRDGVVDQISLHNFQLQRTSGYSIVHFVLADSFGDGSSLETLKRDLREVEAVSNRLEVSAAISEKGFLVEITRLNLLIPTSEEASFPNVFQAMSDGEPWVNVVALPETQIENNTALVPTPSDYRYVAHAVVSIASAAGLWERSSKLGTKDLFRDPTRHGMQIDADECFLFRSKGRFVVAPELPVRVFSEAFRREPRLPVDREQSRFEKLGVADAESVINKALTKLLDEHGLNVPDTTKIEALLEPQGKVGFIGFLKLLFNWLVFRFPRMVKEDVENRVGEVKQWAIDRSNELLGGDESRIALGFESGEPAQKVDIDLGLIATRVRPQPDFWTHVRGFVFGIVDGGDLPIGLESIRFDGHTKFVVDRNMVVEQPKTSLTSAHERNFMVLLLQNLEQLRERCESQLDFVRAKIQEEKLRAEKEEEERVRKSSIGLLRRLLSWVLKRLFKFALFLIASFVLVVVPFLIPIASIVALIWACVGGALLIFSVVRGMWRYLTKKFREDFRRRVALQLQTLLQAAERLLQCQIERAISLRAIGEEWHRILSFVVHQPYGPLLRNPKPRLRNHFLELPLSHQIVEPEITDVRIRGLIERVRESAYSERWLSEKYVEMERVAREEFEMVHESIPFRPDHAPSPAHSDLLNHRQRLLACVENGRARRWLEYSARVEAHKALLGLADHNQELEDVLFTSTGPIPGLFAGNAAATVVGKVSEFLTTIQEGNPVLPSTALFNTDSNEALTRFQDLEFKRLDPILIRPEKIVKDGVEDLLIDGWSPDFGRFVFACVSLEVSPRIAIADLRMFSESPTPTKLDLSLAKDRWKLPPPDDEYDLLPPTPEEDSPPSDTPNIPDPETSKDVIRPEQQVVTPPSFGPYTFLAEYDGVPARWQPAVDSPIPWRLRSKAGPANAFEMVSTALQQIANATGYSFVFTGTFDHLPGKNQVTIDVGWATRAEFSRVSRENGSTSDRVVGWGGPSLDLNSNGDPVIVGGRVVLNAVMDLEPKIGPGLTQYMVVLHELGHVMNLGHVQSSAEVMYHTVDDDLQTSWGPGDRRGLFTLAKY